LEFAPVGDRVVDWARQTETELELDGEFEWWELVAAAAASSLGIGALLALAATPGAREADAREVESAYFPWASGLNGLLDSLVDLDEDPVHASHLRRYPTSELAGERLVAIAAGARDRVRQLPDGRLHEAIFAAMGALYLARPEAWRPGCEAISEGVLDALGPFARPSLLIHIARRGGRGGAAVFVAKRRGRTGCAIHNS
jgi:hypothetical protein